MVAVRGLWIGAMNIPKGHYIFLEMIKGTTFWYNFRLIFFLYSHSKTNSEAITSYVAFFLFGIFFINKKFFFIIMNI
jgi:hypothetical protein